MAVCLLKYYQQLRKYKKPLYEVCRLKRQADYIRSEKLAVAWCNPRSNEFLNLVRQSRGNSEFSGCNVIDGLTTDDDISNIFSSKISLLLNSDLDQPSRNNFISGLTNSISKSDLLTSEISSTVTVLQRKRAKLLKIFKLHSKTLLSSYLHI